MSRPKLRRMKSRALRAIVADASLPWEPTRRDAWAELTRRLDRGHGSGSEQGAP